MQLGGKEVHISNSILWNKSSFLDFILDQVTLEKGLLSYRELPSHVFFFFFFLFIYRLVSGHLERESYLQHATLDQRINMPLGLKA